MKLAFLNSAEIACRSYCSVYCNSIPKFEVQAYASYFMKLSCNNEWVKLCRLYLMLCLLCYNMCFEKSCSWLYWLGFVLQFVFILLHFFCLGTFLHKHFTASLSHSRTTSENYNFNKYLAEFQSNYLRSWSIWWNTNDTPPHLAFRDKFTCTLGCAVVYWFG